MPNKVNTIPKKNPGKPPENTPENPALYLDTLALLRKAPPIEGYRGAKSVLLKRARSKYLSNNISLKLADLDTDLKKSYYNSFHCASLLQQKDNKLIGKYCNNRWCLVCNRIRTAKLINGYRKPLSELPDPYFVTLTVPNVPDHELRTTIKNLIHTFRKIKDTFRKRQTPIRGIRKIECTYNAQRNDYHPHLHLVVEGEDVGKGIISEWINHYPTAKRISQDIRPANENSILELFKYFTKLMAKDKQFHTQALDVIFQAMRGLRVFQPMGIKKVKEDIDELLAETYEDLEDLETYWIWNENDWYDKDTGEALTEYTPSENLEKLKNSIR